MRTSSYKSPYSHLDADELAQVQFYMGKEDRDFLRCLDPDFGFVTYLGSRALQALVSDFKLAGITHYDPDNKDLIQSIIARRLGAVPPAEDATAQADLKTGQRNDKRGASAVRVPPANHQVHPTPDDSANRVGRGPGRGGKKAVKAKGQVQKGRSERPRSGIHVGPIRLLDPETLKDRVCPICDEHFAKGEFTVEVSGVLNHANCALQDFSTPVGKILQIQNSDHSHPVVTNQGQFTIQEAGLG